MESWTFPQTVQVWMASSAGSGVDQRSKRMVLTKRHETWVEGDR